MDPSVQTPLLGSAGVDRLVLGSVLAEANSWFGMRQTVTTMHNAAIQGEVQRARQLPSLPRRDLTTVQY